MLRWFRWWCACKDIEMVDCDSTKEVTALGENDLDPLDSCHVEQKVLWAYTGSRSANQIL